MYIQRQGYDCQQLKLESNMLLSITEITEPKILLCSYAHLRFILVRVVFTEGRSKLNIGVSAQ